MFYTSGWVHVICGCMFCGKTDEMLRLLRRFSIAGRHVVLIKPRLDTRTTEATVLSRSGAKHNAVTVASSDEIEAVVAAAYGAGRPGHEAHRHLRRVWRARDADAAPHRRGAGAGGFSVDRDRWPGRRDLRGALPSAPRGAS